LLAQEALRDEEREVGVAVAGLLEHPVHHPLDVLPERVPVGADDHAALHVRVVRQLRLEDQVHEPLGETLLTRSELVSHGALRTMAAGRFRGYRAAEIHLWRRRRS